MTFEKITKEQVADALGLVTSSGEISEQAVANLLRHPLKRWGLAPKASLLGYARHQVRAAGLEDVSAVTKVLDRIIALGEADEVHVGQDIYVAPALPRWISVGEGIAAYLGVSGPPPDVSLAPTGGEHAVVQRIHIGSDDDVARLHLAGVREVTIDEWVSPLGYLRHVGRRVGKPVRSDTTTLADFWDLLETELSREGLPLGPDAEVRMVTGEPGQFFGSYDTPEPVGRWTAAAPDGVWCAFRRGYGESHWHPVIISVHNEECRALDLYDHDEWRWALLARGRRIGMDEAIATFGGKVRLGFPAPKQIRTAMDILGVSVGPWDWMLYSDAPDLWAIFR